jgi:hypothetical protein
LIEAKIAFQISEPNFISMSILRGILPFLLMMTLFTSIRTNNTTSNSIISTSLSEDSKTQVSKAAFVERLERRSFLMDVTYNKDVKKFVKKYISKDRIGTEILLGRQTTFLSIFEKYIEEFQVVLQMRTK